MGAFYFATALALAGLAMIDVPAIKLLLWPAGGCGIAALGYFGGGPGIYRKSAGKLPWSTRLMLGPILFGQWLSLLYYKRQCRAWDVVTPRLWIGRVLNQVEAQRAAPLGVTAVLDLTAEFSEADPFLACDYLNVPILDLTAPTADQLRRSVKFIEDQTAEGIVYVHCKIGYSRSAAVVAAYLAAEGITASANDSIAQMRSVRPTIVIRPEAEAAI